MARFLRLCTWLLALGSCLLATVQAECSQDCAKCSYRLVRPGDINFLACTLECEGQLPSFKIWETCKDLLQVSRPEFPWDNIDMYKDSSKQDESHLLAKKYGGFMKRYSVVVACTESETAHELKSELNRNPTSESPFLLENSQQGGVASDAEAPLHLDCKTSDYSASPPTLASRINRLGQLGFSGLKGERSSSSKTGQGKVFSHPNECQEEGVGTHSEATDRENPPALYLGHASSTLESKEFLPHGEKCQSPSGPETAGTQLAGVALNFEHGDTSEDLNSVPSHGPKKEELMSSNAKARKSTVEKSDSFPLETQTAKMLGKGEVCDQSSFPVESSSGRRKALSTPSVSQAEPRDVPQCNISSSQVTVAEKLAETVLSELNYLGMEKDEDVLLGWVS